jgi:hypothetical protein
LSIPNDETIPYGINDAGYQTPQGPVAFIYNYESDQVQSFSLQQLFYVINDTGQIVGANLSGPSNTNNNVLIYSDGIYTPINDPLAVPLYRTQPRGINDYGEVVGLYYRPTPEPSTWAMILIGFVGLGYAQYRRARASQPANATLRANANPIVNRRNRLRM